MELNVITNCCRLCFFAKNENINISEISASGLNVAQTIDKYVQVEVVDEDLLPENICIDCWKMIESFHWFHDMINTARTEFLKNIIGSRIKEELDESITAEFQFESVHVNSLMDIDTKPIMKEIDKSQPISNIFQGQSSTIEGIPGYVNKTCEMCTTTFDSINQAREHYLKEHKKPKGYFRCCGMRLLSDIELNEHIQWHLNPNFFRCHICKISMKSKKLLSYHNQRHENRFVCNICNRNFVRKQTLTEHMLLHDDKQKYVCDMCKMSFSSKMLIELHINTVHVNASRGMTNDRLNNPSIESDESPSISQVSQGQSSTTEGIPDHINKTCDMCTTTFDSLNQAREHYLKEHKKPKGYFRCCGMRLLSDIELNEHIQWHLNPNLFRCHICEISLKSKNLLIYHNQRHENRFVCNICNRNFVRKQTLTEHMLLHDDKQKYACNICGKKFFQENSVNRHKRKWHSLDTVDTLDLNEIIDIPDYFDMSCDACPEMLQSLKHAQSHYLEEHQIVKGYVKCCELKLYRISEAKDHIKWHLDQDTFRCDKCDISFNSKRKLISHNTRHTENLVCDICGKEFVRKQSLVLHRQTHDTTNMKYTCSTCNKKFPVEHLLRHHLKNSHIKEKTEICEYCGKQFARKRDIQVHLLKMHSNEPPKPKEKLQCTVCHAWINGKIQLKRHMQIHTDPIKCDKCDTVLANQQSLDDHNRRMHKNGGLKFECHLCPKVFRSHRDFEDHVSVHTNEKKHKCTYCEHSFIWRTDMYKHRKKVHFEKWSEEKNRILASRAPTDLISGE